MRSVSTLGCVLVLVTGCRSPNIFLTPRTQLLAKTSGVVLHEDGSEAHAAMMGTTCSFDPIEGFILGDYDLTPEDELVWDAWEGEVLARSDAGVHVIGVHTGNTRLASDTDQSTVLDGALTGAGPLGLHHWLDGSCTLQWYDEAIEVPIGECTDGQIAPVRSGEIVFIATDERLLWVSMSGAVIELGSADQVIWDHRDGIAVSASGSDLVAWTRDGTESWSWSGPGVVDGITVLPDQLIGVIIGGVWYALDANTGELFKGGVEAPPGDVIGTTHGGIVGFETDSTVTFYEVTVGSFPPRADGGTQEIEPRQILD